LFKEDEAPIHFFRQTVPKFRKVGNYSYVEEIALSTLLNNDMESAYEFLFQLSNHLNHLIGAFQLKSGIFAHADYYL